MSLGPLSPKKYCTYSCPFCYVNAGFLSYSSLDVPGIVAWLRERREQFDIVYVSGDTDSFAPPRTDQGISLLRELISLDVDIMFTTRMVFTDSHLGMLQQICQDLRARGHYLFGCVSVAQLSLPHLEPPPIAPPKLRLAQLCSFKERGLISVLAARPFLPNVPPLEMVAIVQAVEHCVDVVLGEVWYTDAQGKMERRVFQGDTPSNVVYIRGPMDFDINKANWKIYEANDTRQRVEEYCAQRGIPFFMRSRPAVEWIRANGPRKPDRKEVPFK